MTGSGRLVICAGLFLALTGMQLQPYWGPNGNGKLDHQDDQRWVRFNEAIVVEDGIKGEYRAAFSQALARLDDTQLDITGYMLPVESNTHAAHFVLTRRSTGCPFCPPNEPTEAIEVFADTPVQYTQAPLTVTGRLHLSETSDTGLFYRLDHAKVK